MSVPVSNGESVSFIYQSVKDVIKWHSISVKDHIAIIMNMGTLIYMTEENYNKVIDESLHKSVTKSDIDAVYQAYKDKHNG